MKRLAISFILLIASVSMALAQSPVVTKPYGATINNSSGSISVTNTFQSIWIASTANTGRVDCLIQNKGSNSMYLYFGNIVNATTPNSLTLGSGTSFRCGNNGTILKDQISITGTSGDTFFAIQY